MNIREGMKGIAGAKSCSEDFLAEVFPLLLIPMENNPPLFLSYLFGAGNPVRRYFL